MDHLKNTPQTLLIRKEGGELVGGEERPIPDCHVNLDRSGSITSSSALKISGTSSAIWYPSPYLALTIN